jgi:hypothetical protein
MPVHAAEQVGAVGEADAAAVGTLEGGQTRAQHLVDLAPAALGQAELTAFVLQRPVRHQGGDQERIAGDQELDTAVVDEIAVLDGADTGLDRPVHSTRGVGVRGNIAVDGLGLLDNRAQLPHRVLGGIDPVGGRRDAAGSHYFDVVAAFTQFVAGGGAHRVHAVGDTAGIRARRVIVPQVSTRTAAVPVAARLTERTPAEVQARTADNALGLGGG